MLKALVSFAMEQLDQATISNSVNEFIAGQGISGKKESKKTE